MKRYSLFIVMAVAAIARGDSFNIEIDYMVDTDHSHQPSTAVINAFKQPFLCQGHTVNVVVDDAIPHCDVLLRNPSDCSASLFGYDDNTFCSFGQIRQSYFDHDGQAGWYYGVFAHKYQNTSCSTSGSSGLSNGGQFFIVTMGSFSGQVGTPFDNASTLFHEFGHDLGLSHCGTQYCGSNTGAANYVGPYVPNMPSSMAYQYQLAGVETNIECQGLSIPDSVYKEIDYSHGVMCTVDENALDEEAGSYMTYLDWDCDGSIETSVAQNINNSNSGWCGAGGNRTTVADYNEWANLSPGAKLVEAAETGDADALRGADYRFIDPGDVGALKAAARELLETNKRPELRSALIRSVETGDASWLADARFVTFDPLDKAAVKAFAREEIDRRQKMLDEQPCISAEEWNEAQAMRASCPQPTLVTESCLAGENVYVGTVFCIPNPPICFDLGLCGLPHGGVQTAHDAHPGGSVFYLAPQTYDESGTVILDTRGVWTCERQDGTGSAVIR